MLKNILYNKVYKYYGIFN